jgi:hypothetical protein
VTVHSTQLGSGVALTAGYHTLYTVPANTRTIFKGIWLRNGGAAAFVGGVQLHLASGGSPAFFIPLAASPAAGSTVWIALWVVLNAGDQLNVAGSASGIDAIVAGTELSTT